MGFLEQDSTVETANLRARRSTRLKLSEKMATTCTNDFSPSNFPPRTDCSREEGGRTEFLKRNNKLRLPAEDMEVSPYPRRKPGASQRSLPLIFFRNNFKAEETRQEIGKHYISSLIFSLAVE